MVPGYEKVARCGLYFTGLFIAGVFGAWLPGAPSRADGDETRAAKSAPAKENPARAKRDEAIRRLCKERLAEIEGDLAEARRFFGTAGNADDALIGDLITLSYRRLDAALDVGAGQHDGNAGLIEPILGYAREMEDIYQREYVKKRKGGKYAPAWRAFRLKVEIELAKAGGALPK